MKHSLKILVFAWLVMQVLVLPAQDRTSFWDSLEYVVQNTPPDTTTVLHLNELFDYYSTNGQKKAMPFIERAWQLADSLQYPKGLALSTINLAMAYDMQGNYQEALQLYLTALRLTRDLGNEEYRSRCLLSLGYFYGTLGNYSKAIECTRESALLEEKLKGINAAALGWNNLGYYYLKNHQYDSALFFTLKSYEVFKAEKDSIGLGYVFSNLGGIAWTSDSNAFKALNYCLKAQDMYLSSPHTQVEILTECQLEIGFLYLQLKNYHMAGSYLNKGLEQARQHNLRHFVKNGYKYKSDLYAAVGDYAKAYEMYHQFFQLHDSLYSQQSMLNLKQLQAEYEFETQEAKIALLHKDKIIKQDELEQQLMIRNGFMVMFGLLLVFATVLFRNNLQKRKNNHVLVRQKEEIEDKNKAIVRKNEMLQEQKRAMLMQSRNLHEANQQINKQKSTIEQKNKDITDSLNYARGMQYAMLPQPEQLKGKISDAFVWLQPRDIVSGDFFWYEEQAGKLFIAAVDCTGHGVPGAFMSLIADNYLRQLVRNEQVYEPDQLLEQLRAYVPKVLNQATTQNQDGMEVGLCVIDLASKELRFAGARSNLYYVQNERLYKIKGDRSYIGGRGTTGLGGFNCHKVEFKRRTRFYLYTDGLRDQFGGPEDKKFGEKQLNQLLLEIYDLPMAKQQMLIKQRMENWMAGYEQIDDMLIMGWSLP
jgi:serine phosphatase RsbU (regulator of sigma subunit)